ncbi:MAG: hypothetical protein WCV71_02065 [Patescibacteria group bacterium]|jgi:hypothetical protein
MKNKTFIPIFILVAIVLANQIVHAVPAVPGPTCEITAIISSLEKNIANTEEQGQNSRTNFDYYKINLDILSISTYQQRDGLSCDSFDIEQIEQSGQKLSLEEYNNNPILIGQKIKAKMSFGGDERFNGYFLSEIQILENTTTTQNPKDNESSYWYFVIPVITLSLSIILYILFRKKN